jgi:tetratricopeptide (TPR) repeat protein
VSNSTFDVFISYSHQDADWVRSWLLPRLEAAGLRACIDSRDFDIGVPSIINMEKAVELSRKTLLILSPSWVQSEWTKFESLLIQTDDPSGTQRRTLPLLLENCQLPKRLGIFTHADFTDPTNRDNELKRVIAAIRDSPASQSPQDQAIQPNLVHPYALQANFTGRVNERQELTAWLADDARPICALIAMGGMGKSALAWYWMQNDVLPQAQPADALKVDGVMWWSFYEGESSFAKFIDDALKYVSGQPIDMTNLPTTYDRAQELRRQLQTKRILFILDGFERQLRAYARLDAAYQRDDTTAPSRDERACIDPITARWLRDIAAVTTRAKVLLTTRLMVRDLEDRAGDALAGVLKRELKELPREDAVKFMREQGVKKGTSAEIADVCDAYGNHPLSLRLLSGLIARDARMQGDIAAAPRHDIYDDLVQRQHHVLEQSYDAMPEGERTLLSCIAAFRSPMTYDALLIFNTFGNEARFEVALDNLRVRGLLQRDTAHNRYDLHPIVRHYAYDRLTDKTGVHTRLRDYFAQIPTPDKDKIQSIEDLTPVIELYHHTVRAGRYDEARELFYARLGVLLYFRFGAYQTCIELLRALFPNDEERPLRLKGESWQAWTLNELANSYSLSGQPRRAMFALQVAIPIAERLNERENVASGLENIAIHQIILGELAAAEQNLRRSVELSHESKDEFSEGVEFQYLGQLLAYCGAFDEAEAELLAAQEIFDRRYKDIAWNNFVSTVRAYRSLLAILMGSASNALTMADESRKWADKVAKEIYPFERDIIHAEWLLGAALVMEAIDLNAAATHLTDALARCRRANLVELEPDILLTWARWHRARGNGQEAHAHAEEALTIADRCEYRLKQAEIHNFLARLALDAGDGAGAREHAEIAKESAWCDGPPHCYKPALDEAEGMLKDLGGRE